MGIHNQPRNTLKTRKLNTRNIDFPFRFRVFRVFRGFPHQKRYLAAIESPENTEMQAKKLRSLLFYGCVFAIPIGCMVVWIGGFVVAVQKDRARFASRLQEGRTIVKAINDYKAKKGNWPEKLDDLVPDFLASLPENWGYSSPSFYGRLSGHAAFHCVLTYYFPNDKGEPLEPGLFPPGIVHGWIRNDEKTETFIGED